MTVRSLNGRVCGSDAKCGSRLSGRGVAHRGAGEGGRSTLELGAVEITGDRLGN